MSIKLVKNFESGRYSSINEEFLLQIIDNNKQLEGFSGKNFYLLNPFTNERFEIAPEVAKFDFARYVYIKKDRDYVIFTSAKLLNEQDVEIQFYRYSISDNELVLFYTKVAKLSQINETYFIKVFALPENYCLIEFIDVLKPEDKYELVVKNYNSRKTIVVNNSLINQYGLDKIVPLSGNLCAIKIGDEIIGTININRFVSDMAIGLDNIYIDVLDRGNGQFSMPFLRKFGNNLTYLKRDYATNNEEIVIYDYTNKVRKVRYNTNIEDDSNLKNIYVINDIPYYFADMEDGVSIINLNTQKPEAELYNNATVQFVSGDLIVARKVLRKNFFTGKIKEQVDVYRFPDTRHSIYKTVGTYGCCVEHFHNLLIFVS